MSHWPIIFSITISSLILAISQSKLYRYNRPNVTFSPTWSRHKYSWHTSYGKQTSINQLREAISLCKCDEMQKKYIWKLVTTFHIYISCDISLSCRRALKATFVLIPLFGIQWAFVIHRPSFTLWYEVTRVIIQYTQVCIDYLHSIINNEHIDIWSYLTLLINYIFKRAGIQGSSCLSGLYVRLSATS